MYSTSKYEEQKQKNEEIKGALTRLYEENPQYVNLLIPLIELAVEREEEESNVNNRRGGEDYM